MATGSIENGDYSIEDENGDHVIKDPGGTVIMRWDESLGEWQWEGTDHAGLAVLTLGDTTADPSANGEVQRNAGDIKVYSGGSVRNLSDVGDTIAVSDDGTEILANPDDINFTATNDASVSVAEDTDNTVTVTIDAVDTRTGVSDNGGLVVAEVTDISFNNNVSVTDDGDGTVTVDATDTRTDVSDDTTLVVSDVTNINFGTDLSVTDDADGTVTVDSAAASAGNVPAWVEDGNSPFVISGSSSGTYTLSGTYDAVMMIIISSDTPSAIEMQINGDTGANYNYVNAGGGSTASDTKFPRGIVSGRNAGQVIHMSGRWNVDFGINFGVMDEETSATEAGRNPNVASPLDTITLNDDGGSNFDLTARVYGLD